MLGKVLVFQLPVMKHLSRDFDYTTQLMTHTFIMMTWFLTF